MRTPTRRFHVLVAIALVLGARTPSWAEDLGAIKGSVVTGGVPAKIRARCGPVAKVVTTKQEGMFSIRGLPAGNCTLRITAKGFQSETVKVVVPAGGTAKVKLGLAIAPRPKQAP